jgi:hypothetical protein
MSILGVMAFWSLLLRFSAVLFQSICVVSVQGRFKENLEAKSE